MLRKTFKLTSAASIVILAALVSCGPEQGIKEQQVASDTVDSTSLAGSLKQLKEQDSVKASLPEEKIERMVLRARGNTLQQLAYNTDTLYLNAGAKAVLTLVNEALDMPMIHNVVITKAGADRAVAVAGAKIGAPGNYVPKDTAVIAASALALPGQQVELEFTAPAEKGTYEFLCTYPGHWPRMHGKLIVE